jgi:surface carbohydrate biosynthesis protein
MSVIGIPIEIKAREFHGKLWLAAKLARAGHKVALGDKSHLRATLFEEVKPDIYISKSMCKGGGTEKIFEQLKQYGASVTVLDSEGGLGSSKNKWLEMRVTEELLEYVDAIFAWGEIQASALEETTYSPENIHVTGNPRFDLLRPELREFYSEQAKKLKEEFGNYILINTNFGVTNSYSEENINQVFDEREIRVP